MWTVLQGWLPNRLVVQESAVCFLRGYRCTYAFRAGFTVCDLCRHCQGPSLEGLALAMVLFGHGLEILSMFWISGGVGPAHAVVILSLCCNLGWSREVLGKNQSLWSSLYSYVN